MMFPKTNSGLLEVCGILSIFDILYFNGHAKYVSIALADKLIGLGISGVKVKPLNCCAQALFSTKTPKHRQLRPFFLLCFYDYCYFPLNRAGKNWSLRTSHPPPFWKARSKTSKNSARWLSFHPKNRNVIST